MKDMKWGNVSHHYLCCHIYYIIFYNEKADEKPKKTELNRGNTRPAVFAAIVVVVVMGPLLPLLSSWLWLWLWACCPCCRGHCHVGGHGSGHAAPAVVVVLVVVMVVRWCDVVPCRIWWSLKL